jgi:hypothetical protein
MLEAGPQLGAPAAPELDVTAFYDETTGSVQYIVADPITRRCAVIDPTMIKG